MLLCYCEVSKENGNARDQNNVKVRDLLDLRRQEIEKDLQMCGSFYYAKKVITWKRKNIDVKVAHGDGM